MGPTVLPKKNLVPLSSNHFLLKPRQNPSNETSNPTKLKILEKNTKLKTLQCFLYLLPLLLRNSHKIYSFGLILKFKLSIGVLHLTD